jgi:hypothetical protein
MDINAILAGLRREHEQLGEAILSLERLVAGGAKRRGRPPLWLSELKEKRKPGRPAGSTNKRSVKVAAAGQNA